MFILGRVQPLHAHTLSVIHLHVVARLSYTIKTLQLCSEVTNLVESKLTTCLRFKSLHKIAVGLCHLSQRPKSEGLATSVCQQPTSTVLESSLLQQGGNSWYS